MAKNNRIDNTDIVKVDPTFLTEYIEDDHSLDSLKQYKSLPRLKVIQSMSTELKNQFGEGSVIVRPGDAMVAELGQPFCLVPLFHFTQFIKWRDLKDKDGPAVVETSFDPMSDLGQRAQDPDLRRKMYDGDEDAKKPRFFRFVEHIRFASVIYGDHELAGSHVVLSFEKGDYWHGRNFVEAIKLRRATVQKGDKKQLVQVPLWSQVWQFTPEVFNGKEGDWVRLRYEAPTEVDPIIDPQYAEQFRSAFLEYKDFFEAERLRVDADELEEEETGEF